MRLEPEPGAASAGEDEARTFARTSRRRLKRFRRSRGLARIVGAVLYGALWFVYRTQASIAGSSGHRETLAREHPAIVALWHGQHLLAPFFRPSDLPYVALLSRSTDAEINAAVVEHFGIETVRGSGGRVRKATARKGGVSALISLVRALSGGKGVCMIADVPKGVARQAGMGIITLARLTGRPIIPSAAATSRRLVLRRTWDATTVPLPFGRIAVVLGEPIHVPRGLDAAALEAKRQEVTLAIEAANRQALALADGRSSADSAP